MLSILVKQKSTKDLNMPQCIPTQSDIVKLYPIWTLSYSQAIPYMLSPFIYYLLFLLVLKLIMVRQLSLSSTASTAIVFGIAYYLYHLQQQQQKKTRNVGSLPPRAPGYIPIIGHLLQLVKPFPIQELFYQWSRQVGPVFMCHFGTQRWLILNSFEAIKDLIVDRGTIYSSRKLPDTLVYDAMQGEEGGGFAFFPYGTSWRRLRRIAHGGLVKNKIDEYQPILDDRRIVLLSHLHNLSQDAKANLNKGVCLTNFIEHYTMTAILAIAFGDMCNFEPNDPVLHKAFAITERAASTMSPADQLREFFPILKVIWPVKREKYFRVRNDSTEFYGKLLEKFKKTMETYGEDAVQDCFVKEVFKLNELTDLQIMNFIGIFVGAGSETTASTLEWLVAFLANNPEVQRKAFEEIKQVVGTDRLPGSCDEPHLPYLQCIILETLRLRPPAPIAIPHSTTKDDVYKNWVIPQDTIVVLNLYAAHQDSKRFANPKLFNPDRHMPYVKETLNQQRKTFAQSIEDRPHLSFSTGRRVCVGIHLAERSLFMAASMLVSCFKIDYVGKPIPVDSQKDIRAPTWTPASYRVCLTPRHENVGRFY
ncbi:cytochrome P450 [Mycotypha africana]|uniref:cytochrome P450 n=1 Tax=Mycotypha africana TaxID=64632 RepID=UPI002301D9E9|nr:cytochrome P450 [Mycotypha africana]KAI8983968.1 cytochrome P450 [Mycotypha africana]